MRARGSPERGLLLRLGVGLLFRRLGDHLLLHVRRRLFGDYVVADWTGAGLLFPSMVTAILRTIKQAMVERRLGRMADGEVQAVGRLLRRALAL